MVFNKKLSKNLKSDNFILHQKHFRETVFLISQSVGLFTQRDDTTKVIFFAKEAFYLEHENLQCL